MQKHILTILLTLFSQTVIAQTSFDEPDLDISVLDSDISVTCNKNCKEQLNFDVVTFDSILKKPVGNAKVSSDYGWRIHPVLKRKKFHHGVDFSVPTGTPVKAGQSGQVVYAGWMSGYGKLIVIKHNNTYSTVYGHLHSFGQGIKVGSRVNKGQIIAKSGNTGRSTGAHLHYEIRVNGLAVNHQTGKAGSDQRLVFNNSGKAGRGQDLPSSDKIQASRQNNGRVRAVIR